jgi:hypothetical protein
MTSPQKRKMEAAAAPIAVVISTIVLCKMQGDTFSEID